MIVIVVSVSNFVVLLVNNVFVFMCRIGVINLFIVLNRFIKLIFVVSVVLESSCVGIVQNIGCMVINLIVVIYSVMIVIIGESSLDRLILMFVVSNVSVVILCCLLVLLEQCGISQVLNKVVIYGMVVIIDVVKFIFVFSNVVIWVGRKKINL